MKVCRYFCFPGRSWRTANAEHRPRHKGGVQPTRMNSHASTPHGISDGAPTTNRRSTTPRGAPGSHPGTRPSDTYHIGRRPQAAWAVHCTTRRRRTCLQLNQEHHFEQPLSGASQQRVPQARTHPTGSDSHRRLVSQDCSWDDASQRDVDEGRQPATLISVRSNHATCRLDRL